MLTHSRRQTATKRAGLTGIEILLVVLIVTVALMFALRLRPGRDRSPFSLFGAAPGMTLTQLRASVSHYGSGTLDCRPQFGAYQSCQVKYSPDPGLITTVVAPDKRVIVVQAVNVVGLDGLNVQADSAQGAWNRVAQAQSVPPLAEIGDTGAVRWASRDNRWTAEMHYNGSHDPDRPTQLLLVDTRGVQKLAQSDDDAAEEAKRNGWIPPTAEEAAAAFQRRRANRASEFGAIANTLSTLGDFETAYWNAHHTYTDNVGDLPGMVVRGGTNLEMVSATDSGWTAKAMNPAFPKASCVASGGRVPPEQMPVTVGGKTISGSEGVACDPLPPAESNGQP